MSGNAHEHALEVCDGFTTMNAHRLIWGFGSGRHLEPFLHEGETLTVLAIDIDPTSGATAQSLVARRPLLAAACARGQLNVVIEDANALVARFTAHDESPAHPMVVHLPALHAVPESARQLARVVERIHEETRAAPRAQALLLANLRANLHAFATATDLTLLTGLGHARPAFVLAAGPSLAHSLESLTPLVHKGIVVACDTTLPLCNRVGITVDVLASIDPHAISARHLAHGTAGVRSLAFQPYASPSVVHACAHRWVSLPAGDLLADALAEQTGLPRLPNAETVLLHALQVADLLGCTPIVLIGADFAYVDGLTHAPGTASSIAAPNVGPTVINRRGVAVPSSSTLLRFCAAIELHIRASRTPHWSIDGGGAPIMGAIPATMREVSEALASFSPFSCDFSRLMPPSEVEVAHRRRVVEATIETFAPRAAVS